MFLKSIELFGFKSFPEKCKIDFQAGISAILGPNGCGKSNILDAIKWVLGEQSTRNLRAERMEDVIFNGTETLKPLNVAEVTLILSDVGSVLPVDMSEISIKRRLFRSGESDYFINNHPVKLKEIKELFYDTGIGKTAYSIMEQGKIDQILSNKPEDRRSIFEEAAGITKYKIKGLEAERKLEKTEDNMKQVENILIEVKRSYDSSKIQTEKTHVYRKLKNRMFESERDLHLLKLKSFLEKKNDKEEQLNKYTKLKNDLKTEIDNLNHLREKNLDVINAMESKLVRSQQSLYKLGMDINSKENHISLLEERYREVEKQVASAHAREKEIREKIDMLKKQREERNHALTDLFSRIKEIEKNIENFRKSIQHSEEEMRNNEVEITEQEQEIRRSEKYQLELQNNLREITEDIVQELDKKLKETEYSFQIRKTTEQEIERGIGSSKIHIRGKLDLLRDALKLEQTRIKDDKSLLESSIEALQTAFSYLEHIEKYFKEYKKMVPSFLDEFLSPEGIITRKREIDRYLEETRENILKARRRTEELNAENRTVMKKISEYRKTLEELRMNEIKMTARQKAMEEAISMLSKGIDEQESVSEQNAREIQTAQSRLNDIKTQIEENKKEKLDFERDERAIKNEVERLERNIGEKNKEIHKMEEVYRKKLVEMEQVNERVERVHVDLASINTEIRNIYDNFTENYSRDLAEYEDRMFDIKEQSTEIRNTINELKENLKKLGNVNLMAPEEFEEVKERYEFLSGQLEDLRKAREDLKKVTGEIRRESTELFLKSYESIKKNFHVMFRRLFGGGRGELRLTDTENVLDSGIEIFAQPPGKRLENISLLSGGERSLTAVALLFATYMVKPSPFCVLDEIDAALDEENVGRFISLVREFSESSQFIIITHNKKTVSGANSLIGITMAESGVSKVVSLRLEAIKEEVEI